MNRHEQVAEIWAAHHEQAPPDKLGHVGPAAA